MTNRALLRRDPQKGKKGFSNKGFTVIELLIVLAILAIVASLALPSYRTFIEKRQVTSGAEQLGAFLSAVQVESVKRSENITVSYNKTDSGTWCIGMASGTSVCDCTDQTETASCLIDSQVRIIDQDNFAYPNMLFSMDGDGSTSGSFVFDPARGLIYEDSDLVAFDEAEIELLSEDETYALNVQISANGRVITCSDNSSQQVPGFDVCGRDIQ